MLLSGDRKATLAKPAGVIIITSEEGVKEFDTFACCHCGRHTPLIPLNPNFRYGICTKCGPNAMTCENFNCHKHYAFEKKLDDYEKGILRELS